MNLRYVMGTFLSVSISGDDTEALTRIFLDEVQHLEALLSRYRDDSEISRISRAAGQQAVPVSEETLEVLEAALTFAAQSNGAFDPTLEPLGYRHVTLQRAARTVFLERAGMRLDLGAIGKGFALDKALARVLQAGNPAAVTADFGGQLLFWQRDGFFIPQQVLIEDPATRRATETIRVASNCSISTTSNAERPGHLWHPLKAAPAPQGGSVTVVARTGTEAEALSTAFFVEGRMGTYNFV